MDLIHEVRKKMKQDKLSVNKLSYLIGLSNGYISKLLNGQRRITERVEVIFKDYLSGKYDDIEIPRHTDDKLQRVYLQGYRQAIKDMKEFIELKKDWMLSANSKQSKCTQNYSYFKNTKLFGGSQLWLKKLKIWRRKN